MVKSIPLTHGQVALVDDDLYGTLSKHKWHVSAGGYARATINKKKTYMHRVVMNAAKGQVVDHIQSDAKLDNRRENLRIVTPAQNVRNTRVRRDSSTGFKGVSFRRGKWSAYITHQGTRYALGAYDNLKTAALVYDCACRKLFGEFCQPNLSDTTSSPEIEAIVEKRLNPPPRAPRRASKYKGVSWDKGRWRARIWHNGQAIHLGNFDDEAEAGRVYREHYERLRGT